MWLDFPGARAALDGSAAKANATYVAAEIALTNDRVDRAAELLALLPKSTPPWPERRAFLSAMIALARGDDAGFLSGVEQLRKLRPDERVTRILGRVAAGGRAAGWMPALISAWSEERKPELRSDPFLLPSFEPQSTCLPDEGAPRTAEARGLRGRLRHPPGAPVPCAAARSAVAATAGRRAGARRGARRGRAADGGLAAGGALPDRGAARPVARPRCRGARAAGRSAPAASRSSSSRRWPVLTRRRRRWASRGARAAGGPGEDRRGAVSGKAAPRDAGAAPRPGRLPGLRAQHGGGSRAGHRPGALPGARAERGRGGGATDRRRADTGLADRPDRMAGAPLHRRAAAVGGGRADGERRGQGAGGLHPRPRASGSGAAGPSSRGWGGGRRPRCRTSCARTGSRTRWACWSATPRWARSEHRRRPTRPGPAA